MRAILAFGFVYCCTILTDAALVAAAAGPVQAPDKSKKSQTPYEEPSAPAAKRPSKPKAPSACETNIRKLLDCIGTNIKSPGFKCKIMAVNANKVADVFGHKDWYPVGQGDVTLANWDVVSEATLDAFKDQKPHRREWYSPAVGLQFTFAKDCGVYLAGQYVLLMFFDTRWAELHYKKTSDSPATKLWECPIHDSRRWRDILTNAGVSLTPKSAPSN
jgi:hypothetical protein